MTHGPLGGSLPTLPGGPPQFLSVIHDNLLCISIMRHDSRANAEAAL